MYEVPAYRVAFADVSRHPVSRQAPENSEWPIIFIEFQCVAVFAAIQVFRIRILFISSIKGNIYVVSCIHAVGKGLNKRGRSIKILLPFETVNLPNQVMLKNGICV